ncbi:MAG: hypothetical protein IPP77_12530 [Bacteroidetes bacterium]|nr:hypothetical protein [Bacteroidota bacterium]
MEFPKKYRAPVFIGLFLVLGITSSAILWNNLAGLNKPVNIFERTKGECPYIQWTDVIDSSNKVYPIHIEGELQLRANEYRWKTQRSRSGWTGS